MGRLEVYSQMNHEKRFSLLLLSALLLFSGACTPAEDPAVSPVPSSGISFEASGEESGKVTWSASFYREGGEPLVDGEVRFSVGETVADYTLDEYGSLTVSGLPKNGTMTVSLLNARRQEVGCAEISIAQGAVIDASVDEEGVGHITLREESTEIALIFTLAEDGALRCALNLSS